MTKVQGETGSSSAPNLSVIVEMIADRLEYILTLRDDRQLKQDGSYVTSADYFIHRLVESYLKEHCPDWILISEEDCQSHVSIDLSAKYLFLDPLDGTENFTSGLPFWGVAISTYMTSVHLDSMLFLPELGLKLDSRQKSFARRAGSRVVGLSSECLKESTVSLSGDFEYRITGCCVYNMYNVIFGSFFRYSNSKGAYCWDILPGLNIALIFGLRVTVNDVNYCGEILDPKLRYRFEVSEH